ncbi:aldo/keto reductase [Chitinophaga sp. CF418]|uniref:aldo/keto reductase n=1 Tax=Chitinophaga sp. CF418 TaxID=1855287 RepID=UPI0009124C5E|nr:aldo/keto reductase [Chitinophaga sp. CF418]SHL94799.1 Predicted oxidoreductase [Chitinophaga sp. CF418]
MKYKVLGNTGLTVSSLCLGTMTFGGKGIYQVVGTLGQSAVDELFKRAVDAGINFIDTANVYSEGMSEELTGQAIRNLGLKRDDLVIATKVCAAMGPGVNDKGLSRKHIMQQVEASLKRLNTDYIDLYQAHAYDPVVPLEETLRAMDDLVTSGKVRYIGASNNAAWHLMKALACAEKHNLQPYISMQSHYSIATRELEREVIPALTDQQVGLMVWSPLCAGLLSGKYKRNGESTEAGRYKQYSFIPVDTERAFNILDVLEVMAVEKGATVAQLSLAWLLHQPAVTSVIVGANKLSQLDDNLQSVNVQFTSEELQRLDEVSKLPVEYPNWIFDWRNR